MNASHAHIVQMDNTVIVSDYSQMDRVLKEERDYILNLCKKIKKTGCNVLLIQKSILRCVRLVHGSLSCVDLIPRSLHCLIRHSTRSYSCTVRVSLILRCTSSPR